LAKDVIDVEAGDDCAAENGRVSPGAPVVGSEWFASAATPYGDRSDEIFGVCVVECHARGAHPR
jgi:hypothetical protein